MHLRTERDHVLVKCGLWRKERSGSSDVGREKKGFSVHLQEVRGQWSTGSKAWSWFPRKPVNRGGAPDCSVGSPLLLVSFLGTNPPHFVPKSDRWEDRTGQAIHTSRRPRQGPTNTLSDIHKESEVKISPEVTGDALSGFPPWTASSSKRIKQINPTDELSAGIWACPRYWGHSKIQSKVCLQRLQSPIFATGASWRAIGCSEVLAISLRNDFSDNHPECLTHRLLWFFPASRSSTTRQQIFGALGHTGQSTSTP
ncbi:uncharacterized protein LOC129057649 [Pongo abelii]|uniref:uncharacterized protein LOC129057649 n=1 Tax=Pongo abelii TaxID=9601 RepID=UPI0023E780CB|nr:uncharacterized protein LOC129057649 [Pongo abelii]